MMAPPWMRVIERCSQGSFKALRMVCGETSKRRARSSTVTRPEARAMLRISDWRWVSPVTAAPRGCERPMVRRFADAVNAAERPRRPILAGCSGTSAEMRSSPDQPERPHPIVKRDFAYRRVIEAARAQGLDQVWKVACIPDRKGHDRTVEIGPQGNVILSHPLHQIAEVLGHGIDGNVRITMCVRSHVGHTEIETHEAVRFFDGVELPVSQVAGRAANRMRASVGCHNRSGADRCHIPESALVEV